MGSIMQRNLILRNLIKSFLRYSNLYILLQLLIPHSLRWAILNKSSLQNGSLQRRVLLGISRLSIFNAAVKCGSGGGGGMNTGSAILLFKLPWIYGRFFCLHWLNEKGSWATPFLGPENVHDMNLLPGNLLHLVLFNFCSPTSFAVGQGH